MPISDRDYVMGKHPAACTCLHCETRRRARLEHPRGFSCSPYDPRAPQDGTNLTFPPLAPEEDQQVPPSLESPPAPPCAPERNEQGEQPPETSPFRREQGEWVIPGPMPTPKRTRRSLVSAIIAGVFLLAILTAGAGYVLGQMPAAATTTEEAR